MIHRLSVVSRLWATFLLVGLAARLSLTALDNSTTAQAAAAAVPAPGLKVIQSNADALILELDVPSYELQTVDETQAHSLRIAIDGATALTEQGYPELPKFSALLGIPAQGRVSVRVLQDSVEEVPGQYRLAPAAMPAQITGDLQPGTLQRVADSAAYASTELYPAESARVVETAWLRDQRVARIEIYPFQYVAATGALRWHRHLRIELRLETTGTSDPLAVTTANDGPFEQILRNTLLNYDIARQWRSRAAAPRLAAPPMTAAPRYKVVVDHDGLYRITYNDLVSAGLVMTSFDPRNLHLSNQSLDVAIEVVGESDGRFDPGDYILFYGQRFRGDLLAAKHAAEANDWITLNGWQPQFNAKMVEKYTDDNVYWLVTGTTPGLRMSLLNGTPAGAPVADYYMATVHAEQSNEWKTTTYSSEDTWFWQRIPVAYVTATYAYTADLTAPAAVPVNATVRAEAAPMAYNPPANPTARVEFWLNSPSNLLADLVLTSATRLKLNTQIPPSALLEGQNTLTLTVPTSNIELYFDWFEIQYARRFQANHDQLTFSDNRSGARQYAIGNFMTSTLHVLNVSNPWQPQRVLSSSVTSAAGRYSATFQIAASVPVTYFVAGADQIQLPKQISRYVPPDLGSSNGADYVIITHRDFITSMQTLAAYRAAEGLRVKIIGVDDLYNQFTDGIYHPIAIKDFLKYAYANWQPPAPTYVLLVGDGHWNFKNSNPSKYGSPTPIFMPPNLGWVDPYQGEVDTANELVEIVGNDPLPDMLVGRIPVNTAAEADVVVNKIITYETHAAALPFRQRMAFVADNVPDPKGAGDFVQFSNNLIYDMLPGTYTADRVYANDYACLPGFSPCPQVNYAITSTMNLTGALFVSYVGHASLDRWGDESFLINANVATLKNLDRLPIILSMTCLDGYWLYPGASGLMETMLRAANGGSVASFSPTGLGVSTGHDVLERGLLKAVFQQGAARLGWAALAGKVALYASGQNYDLIKTFTVFGDPALRLSLHNIQLNPAQAAQLAVRGSIANYTLRMTNLALLTDTIAVQLVRDWPAIASPTTVTLAPGAAAAVVVSVTVPGAVPAGASGAVTVTAQSMDVTTRAAARLDTMAVVTLNKKFLPLVRKN